MRDFTQGFRIAFTTRLAFRAGLMFHLGFKLGHRVKSFVGS